MLVKETMIIEQASFNGDPMTFSAVWHGDLGEDGLSTMSM